MPNPPDFEVLLFGYSADGAPVEVVDLAAGEMLPADIRSALTDPAVTKWAFNAQFERVCLSRFFGYPTGQYLAPSSWHCTMVWAATPGLPLSLEGVGAVLGLEKQKLKEGKDLIRYFCTPAKARMAVGFGTIHRNPRKSGRFSRHITSGMWKRRWRFSRSSPNSRYRIRMGQLYPRPADQRPGHYA